MLCAAVLVPMFDLRLYEPFVAVAVALLVAVLAVRALVCSHDCTPTISPAVLLKRSCGSRVCPKLRRVVMTACICFSCGHVVAHCCQLVGPETRPHGSTEGVET